jgi:hypothetical protein
MAGNFSVGIPNLMLNKKTILTLTSDFKVIKVTNMIQRGKHPKAVKVCQ